MRREFAAVLCAVALLLAGCQGVGLGTDGGSETPAGTGTPAGTETPTTFELQVENDSSDEGSTDEETDDSEPTVTGGEDRPDPESDRLGWESGYWHNESLDVTNADGLNRSELNAAVNRSMARVEQVRGLEFEERVPVEVISRAEYRNRSNSRSYGDELRTFDNAKFEALFLIGEDTDSIATQESTLGDSVQGYYSPSSDQIVIVSESETPQIDGRTLGHELVHALQDQQFDLSSDATTRDAIQGRNGLVEGDARTVGAAWGERCGAQWECVGTDGLGGSAGSGPANWGVYFLVYFPYSDGSAFVSELRDRGGWAAVDDAYDDLPDGAREVTNVDDYPTWEPQTVTIPPAPGTDWERVRPSTDRDRPDYATVGPSGIAAAQMATVFDDYNDSSVVERVDIFNYDGGRLDSADPLTYSQPGTSGWDGGRMHVYENGSETGYVWRTTWESERDAERFATSWERVVRHWGGERTADGNWDIPEESPYSDAVAIHVEGDTVTVVNAPTEPALSALYDA